MTPDVSTAVSVKNLSYSTPDGVGLIEGHGRLQLTTSIGGRVWIDKKVKALWEAADKKKALDITSELQSRGWDEIEIRCGLCCLVEAGLLVRSSDQELPEKNLRVEGELVSAIIVSYNSLVWLKGCLDSIAGQDYGPIEVILVDNASQDGSANLVKEHAPYVQVIDLKQTCSLAKAINIGIMQAAGDYILLLNPDIDLASSAVGQMVKVAKSSPACAAVAAKLQLKWAPSFLNGLGNLVGPSAWGTDIALGHLDLGQFDTWQKLPSTCFAAALIPRHKFGSIGMLDEDFPMYYEDSEWCYRARLLGDIILAAPQARCLHAFGSQIPSPGVNNLSPTKLRRVTYGRLRFATSINAVPNFWRFLANYLLEDILRTVIYLLILKWKMSIALIKGWGDYLSSLSGILQNRRSIQDRRLISDRDLFMLQKTAPPPLIQSGIPVLTWDVICNEYMPLILIGKTRLFPEFDGYGFKADGYIGCPASLWKRAVAICKNESPIQLIYKTGRKIQWWLAHR